MPFPAPTTGLGVVTKVAVDSTQLTLSLSGTKTHQIVPALQDAAGTVKSGVSLVLTQVALASGGITTYTGTITGGGANALAGSEFVVSGFSNAVNNGTFLVLSSTATTLTLDNSSSVAETHAATAIQEGSAPLIFVSRNPQFVSVSASGLITAVAKGSAVIEVCYPVFDNAHGKHTDGTPLEKVYNEINTKVIA